MKNIIFITQSKQGVGRSFLSYSLFKASQAAAIDKAAVHKTAIHDSAIQDVAIQDLETELSRIRRCFNEAKTGKRSKEALSAEDVLIQEYPTAVNPLVEEMANFEQKVFLAYIQEQKVPLLSKLFCDGGYLGSDLLLDRLEEEEVRHILPLLLKRQSITLELYVVVCGGPMYPPTFLYLNNMLKACGNLYPVTIYTNQVHGFTAKQRAALEFFGSAHHLPILSFNSNPFVNHCSTSKSINHIQL